LRHFLGYGQLRAGLRVSFRLSRALLQKPLNLTSPEAPELPDALRLDPPGRKVPVQGALAEAKQVGNGAGVKQAVLGGKDLIKSGHVFFSVLGFPSGYG
jgi:hypothetical protein